MTEQQLTQWRQKKKRYMLNVLRAKFNGDSEMKRYLMSTGDTHLIEASPYDLFYGSGHGLCDPRCCSKQMEGENVLGTLLMRVRHEIATNQKHKIDDPLEEKPGSHKVLY